MDSKELSAQEHEDFSLVQGGPLYQLALRARMVRPSMDLLPRRIIAFSVITWLPLVVLTLLSGNLLTGVSVPFLLDLDVHVKFLISLPLLIGAELIVHRRVRGVVEQFLERGLIAPDERPRFGALIARAMAVRNSVAVEIVLLALALTGGTWVWRNYVTLPTATWYGDSVAGSLSLTGAGYWYAYVSLPIVRFILLRWYFRLFIWYLFLFGVARLRLMLNPLHPDRSAGLGFLGNVTHIFAPVLMAQTAFVSGVIGNQILHQGATLPSFKLEIIGLIAFVMVVVLAPLAFFSLRLLTAKRQALRAYGLLASYYVNEFRQKWLEKKPAPDAGLLGSADVQSLADLTNSYEVAGSTRLLPVSRGQLLRLAFFLALPLLPLTLTMVPFEEIVDRLLKLML